MDDIKKSNEEYRLRGGMDPCLEESTRYCKAFGRQHITPWTEFTHTHIHIQGGWFVIRGTNFKRRQGTS